MFNIGQFFKKFENARLKEVGFRIIVQKELKEIASIEVPIEAVSIKASVISLNGLSQGARSVIYIKKMAIIDAINREQRSYKVSDIR